MDDETLTKRARLLEIERLIALNNSERNKLNDEIARLEGRRDSMLTERDALRTEQIELFRGLAK